MNSTDTARRIFVAAISVLAGLIVAMVFHSHVTDLDGWPQNSFLFAPRDRYADLLNSTAKTVHNNPYFEQSIGIPAYFPFAYFALGPLATLPAASQVDLYLLLSLLAWVLPAGAAFLRSRPTADAIASMVLLVAVAVFNYPFIFGMDRGNLDTVIGGISFASIVLLHRGRPLTAAAFLSVAIAFKGYPLLLLALFFSAREYRAIVLAMALALAVSIGALMSFQGGFETNATGLLRALQTLHEVYTVGTHSMHYSSDGYNAVRSMLTFRGGPQDWNPLYRLFSPLNLTLVAGSFLIACMPRLSFHTRVFFAVLAAVLFPGVINDYKLVLLVPVLWAFAISKDAWHTKECLAFALLVLLLVPKAYVFLFADVSISCLINPTLLLGALLLMVRTASREFAISSSGKDLQPSQPA